MSKFKIETAKAVVNYLTNLIFKKQIKNQTGIMKTISPGGKVNAEEKAKFAIKKLQENANINVNNLTKSDLEYLAESIVSPLKTAEKTVVKSADIVPFPLKRNFAQELADASKKGDFTRMSGIMQLDPKFKEVMKAFKRSKADEEAYKKMVGPKKLIPDRDIIPYQSPEVQKLSPAEKQKYLITNDKQTAEIMKKGYTFDDIIYAQDNYGMKADEIVEAAKSGEKFPFAEGGVAGLLGERTGFSKGKLANLARRNFMKLLGGVGAGIGALKTGAFKFLGKEAAPVAKEVVKSAGSGTTPPPYFFNLVNKIKNLGDDVTPIYAKQPRDKVTRYKDYELTENITTGEKTIQRFKHSDHQYYDENLTEEVYMNYKPGKGQMDETTKGKTPPDEYTEDTGYLRTSGPNKGELYDTADGIPEDVIKEGTMFEDNITEFGKKITKTKKASGGLARMLGE
jgi:hypothetical protein